MSALDKVLKAAGVELSAAPDPGKARSEATGLLSLAVEVGQEAGLTAAELANITWGLAAASEDNDDDSDSKSKGSDGDNDGDDDAEDDVTKDPLYKKLCAKGMSPKAAAAMVKNKRKNSK